MSLEVIGFVGGTPIFRRKFEDNADPPEENSRQTTFRSLSMLSLGIPAGGGSPPVSPVIGLASPGSPPVVLSGAPPSDLSQAASVEFVRRVARRLNEILEGHINVVAAVTLNASGATSTTITDARIGVFSAFHFTPLTAHAAAIAGSIYVSPQGAGTATFVHSANSNNDCSFNVTIIG